MSEDVKRYDLDGCELYREYDFAGRVYRIENPVAFWWAPGHERHRVLDDEGIVHAVPVPDDCVIRWKPTDATKPVKF